MEIAIVIIVIMVAAAWAMPRVRQATYSTQGEYAKKPSVLSSSEQRFLAALEKIVGDRYRILCQVRVADVVELKIAPYSKGRWSAFNRIQSKSFDFVLCDLQSTEPLLVIELNDSTHDLPNRMKRDETLHQICHSIGLPIIFQPVQFSYDVFELQGRISTAIGASTYQADDAFSFTQSEPPKTESPFGQRRPLRLLALIAPIVAIPLIIYIGTTAIQNTVTSSLQATFDASKRQADKASSQARLARNEQIAAQQREAQNATAAKRDQAARDMATLQAEQDKEKAWQKYYQPSDKCEHATDWNVTVECGNEHIRAKRAFEEKWKAEH